MRAGGEGERETAGTWSMNGQTITLNFNDGTTERVAYNHDGITIEYYGMTFECDSW